MSVWEYKVITSGKGGFATPALLETFLNQLGQDEWEIIQFHPQPENSLAFTGLARRSTQREWTLENAVAAATRVEADKLRAEFEAKFKGAGAGAAAPEEAAESAAAESAAPGTDIRRLRDTESDLDPDQPEEEADEWEKLAKEDELPTFFEAIQPLMRRSQRGPGLSAGVDQVAKRWGLSEQEVIGALKECGFTIPEEENDPPAYLEYDGDLFWVNVNRRGELWINTKEKPRPVFRVVPGRAVAEPVDGGEAEKAASGGEPPAPAAAAGRENPAERPAASASDQRSEGNRDRDRDRNRGHGQNQSQGLPAGPELLAKLRPQMRRNRGGQGRSGSLGFLARALRCRENDLAAAFAALGLAPAEAGGSPPPPLELAGGSWWLNRDQRGGLWINEDELGRGGAAERTESSAAAAPAAPVDGDAGLASQGGASVAAPETAPVASPGAPEANPAVLTAVRLLLKPTKTGAVAAETGRLAETLGKDRAEFVATLVRAGLKEPEKPREKPVFVEHAGEIFWLNKNARGQLWLNAKASKFAGGGSEGAPEAAGEPAAKPARLQRGRRATGAGESPR